MTTDIADNLNVAATSSAWRMSVPRWTILVVIWGILIAVPYWLPLLGGYTALAGRVLVFGLAAMGLNLLLGFTCVLSFGHAAYFGFGAYGAGLTLRYRTLRRSPSSTERCSVGWSVRCSAF